MSYRLLAYSPLLNGAYTRSDRSFSKQYLGPDGKARPVTLRSVASEVGATLNQVILAWMVQSDPVVIPLVATSTLEQVEENLTALKVELDHDQIARLTESTA